MDRKRMFLMKLTPQTGLVALVFTLTLLVTLTARPLQAQQQDSSIYQVESVRVRVTLPLPKQQSSPRAVGLWRGKSIALDRLFSRMIGLSERQEQHDFLRGLYKDVDKLTKRITVNSEKWQPDGSAVDLILSVTFSREQVRSRLDGQGVNYSEVPFPPILLITMQRDSDKVSAFDHALMEAVQFHGEQIGMQIFTPLEDTVDMVNLKPDKIIAGDPWLYRWVAQRYGVNQVWMVNGQVYRNPPVDLFDAPFFQSQGQIIHGGNGLAAQQRLGQATSYAADQADAERCHADQIAKQLIVQFQEAWINQHASRSSMRHRLVLEVEHRMDLKRYAQLAQQLREQAGVAALRVSGLNNRGVVLELDYQGEDSALQRAIVKAGWQVQLAEGYWALSPLSFPAPFNDPFAGRVGGGR
ncbi:hypothetical protein Mmc1_2315 [Magnetococcus marinus MC-1]|uniref:DUF2066 domain-containing protein n=2 Tax=Magnetococcus TaxID=162171 RepID=A0LA22_MAGMM|nr:hypothetical protein Mmc1_2315 [Magnetococcus marinus MC-1]